MDLKDLRDNIDTIDDEILSLFLKRMEVCKKVADYKKENNLPIMQGGREDEVIKRIRSKSPEYMEDGSEALFANIMDVSKCLQEQKIFGKEKPLCPKAFTPKSDKAIAVPGTSGSYSEKACRKLFKSEEIHFYREFCQVCEAVENGTADFGILPIQNTTAGAVEETYELLGRYNFYITSMIRVDISHCLATKTPIDISEITTVYSHEQALHQCSQFIQSNELNTAESPNTAIAADMVKNSDSSENIACICSEDCAKLYGLNIVQKSTANATMNATRFICISKEFLVTDSADTISVSLSIPHVKGSLYRLLTKFYVNGLNLQKIESKPDAGKEFEVIFYLDFDGRYDDSRVSALLCQLKEQLSYFRFMGNFSEIK